jgi:2-polyprenyl-3-methyl-5-hydroxy-6-metoxy-1,4-benzoquinol methylase
MCQEKQLNETAWDPQNSDITKTKMDERIKDFTSYLGWQHTVRLITKMGIPFNKLKIAEVGCGTGTFSLIFGLLGASVTLIDFNQKVLERAKKIYSFYDCKTEVIKANCLDIPPKEIAGTFDLVVSAGLAEHFIGKDRVKCIQYHKYLLKDGGVAFINVPNKLSPFYQWIRFFRKVTGTWEIDIEIPFSYIELNKIAKAIGFDSFYIKGNAPLKRDLVDYSRGFISAVIDVFPDVLGRSIRKWKSDKIAHKKSLQSTQEDMIKYCIDKAKEINNKTDGKSMHFLTDRFSAGVILFSIK